MSGREDLSEQDVSDIEDLKSSLTNSDEKFHDAIVETRLSVRDWVKRFDTNVSASVTKSAPTSPSRYKNYLPPRTASVSDFGSGPLLRNVHWGGKMRQKGKFLLNRVALCCNALCCVVSPNRKIIVFGKKGTFAGAK